MKKPNIESYGYINGRYVDDMNDVIDPMMEALIDIIKTVNPTSHRMTTDEMIQEGIIGSKGIPSDESIINGLKALKKTGVEL